MFKMRFLYIKVPIILILGLLLYSCKEECSDYNLGPYINSNLLSGSETIVFIKSLDDSIVFNGQGRYNTMAQWEYPCRNVEIDYSIYLSEDENFKYRIHMIAGTEDQSPSLTVYFKDYTYSADRYFGYKTEFNLPLNSENLIVGQMYYDSLYIYDRYYQDVYSGDVVNDMTKSRTDTIYPSLLYYNTNFGILKVDFDDGTTWELKEIVN